MRFSVDAWDAAYGTSLQDAADAMETSDARVELDVELPADGWVPIAPVPVAAPGVVLFVDGVRRTDAQVWITPDEGTGAVLGLCASFAAGVVCCCDEGAHVASLEARRGLFTTASGASNIPTPLGTWEIDLTAPAPGVAPSQNLSQALQRKLATLEVIVAANARGLHTCDDDLLVLDGPLRGRTQLPRTVSLIKSHQAAYLPPAVAGIIGQLHCQERTPVFRLGTTWERYTWYLRLPCEVESTWSGVVRLECSPDRTPQEAMALATLSQEVLPRYASEPHKEARAPQNVYPIAGLETHLRHRLGDAKLLWRTLAVAARR